MLASECSRRRIYRLLSFLIPTAVLMLCFALYGMMPFGSSASPLIGDAGAEYYPNLVLLRRILKNGESLFYTWRSGLGVAVVPDVILNFCTSPINLLGMLLPDAMYETYISVMICVRMGIAGYCFALLLQAINKKPDGSVVAFATAYALNMWMLTSYWQITMMGAVIITPLVLLGLLRMVRDRDIALYPLMLALSLIMSSYMSIFTALITGMFWIGLLIALKTPLRKLPLEIVRFLGLSVLSAGIAAIALVPSVLNMASTSLFSEDSFFTLDFTQFYATWQEMIAQFSTAVYPTINAHPANICSSMLVILLIPAFLTAKRIPLRERIYTLFVAGFIWFSLWYVPLNFVWHGLRFPRVTVDRFAYLLPMVLCFMGWRFLTDVPDAAEIEEHPRTVGSVLLHYGQLLLMAAGAAGVLWCVWVSQSSDILVIPAAAAGVLFIVVALIRFMPRKRSILTLLLVVAVTGETAVNSWLALNETLSFSQEAGTVTKPVYQVHADAVRADAGDALFYRTGLVMDEDCADRELLYDLCGGSSLFSSVIPADMINLLELLSMKVGTNYYAVGDLLPLNALLLDEPYYIVDSENIRPQLYEQLGDTMAVKFPYPCSLGYGAAELPAMEELAALSAADIQNLIAQKMTGVKKPIYARADAELTLGSVKNAASKLNAPDTFFVQADAADDPDSVSCKADAVFTVPKDGDYVLDLRYNEDMLGSVSRLKITVGEETVHDTDLRAAAIMQARAEIPERQIISLGKLKKDTAVTVRFFLRAGMSGSTEITLRSFDADAFKEVADKLNKSAMTLTEFRHDSFTGTVTAKEDSLLYISMPYRSGWTAWVDGQKTAIQPAMGAMCALPVSAGTHTVQMAYQQDGLLIGAAVSGGCLLLYIILVLVQIILAVYRKKHPKQEKPAYVPQHG